MTDLQPVRGTRDFYPEELRLRNWLFGIWRETALRFGFEEYDTCVLESEALYIRKAGDEITEQLYSFADKGGRRLALRPELTPSLARMIYQRARQLRFPLKWFAIPQCFRYERMTRGRKREHFQWNMDIVGQAGQIAEIELLSALVTGLEAMGLTSAHVRIHLSDRRLLDAVLDHLDVTADHLRVMIVIDKRDKVTPETLDALLVEQGLAPAQIARLNAIMRMATLAEIKAELGAVPAAVDLENLLGSLARMGYGDWVHFDITVVRGLSYYTGTVFEVRDRGAKLRAIAGGARYLSQDLDAGVQYPAVGFGFGDVVILELLADLKLLPALERQIDFAVIPFSPAEHAKALEIGQALRRAGLRVDGDFSGSNLKRALQRASEIGAARAVLLMPEELARGELVVRDMAARSERRATIAAFLAEPR
ncbi:MAG: histidine--tRNA ligase [Candidatus Lambdaproteobacteria bacterium]|nr:histidine--tRNA ligase [Candidatus Lambdaproteobacteria bacterium]